MTKPKKKWPTQADFTALDQEAETIVRRKAQMRALMGERFAALAELSGLMELDITDETLEAEFRAITARFRSREAVQSVGAGVPKAGEPRPQEKANGARPTQG